MVETMISRTTGILWSRPATLEFFHSGASPKTDRMALWLKPSPQWLV